MLRLSRWPFGRARHGASCVLLFPDSTEIRWLDKVPRLGTRIRSSSGRKSARVVEVLQSGRNTYTVVCGIRDGRAEAPPDLASELLDLARRKVKERRYRRSRYRRFGE